MSHRAHRRESWSASTNNKIPENRVTTNPEYTNTQQGLPDTGILSPLSRHASFLALEFIFAGKRLIVDPYFQYFNLTCSHVLVTKINWHDKISVKSVTKIYQYLSMTGNIYFSPRMEIKQ